MDNFRWNLFLICHILKFFFSKFLKRLHVERIILTKSEKTLFWQIILISLWMLYDVMNHATSKSFKFNNYVCKVMSDVIFIILIKCLMTDHIVYKCSNLFIFIHYMSYNDVSIVSIIHLRCFIWWLMIWWKMFKMMIFVDMVWLYIVL